MDSNGEDLLYLRDEAYMITSLTRGETSRIPTRDKREQQFLREIKQIEAKLLQNKHNRYTMPSEYLREPNTKIRVYMI